MKVDAFTKIVLAIIAINLSILTIKNLDIIPKANANEPASIMELPSNMNYGLVPLNEDGSISVKLSSYDEIDVNITNISTSDKLKVKIEEVDAFAFSFCTVPVEVQ
mgnify:CR=1 FL=1